MALEECRTAYAWALDRLRSVAEEIWDGLYDYGNAYVLAYRNGGIRRALRVEYEYLANPDDVEWVITDGEDEEGGHWEPEGVARFERFSLNACADREAQLTRWLDAAGASPRAG